ncbi:hypothetical protein [Glycomyces tarimensis]
MPTRLPARARAAAMIRLLTALVLALSAVALLTTIDAAVQRTRAAIDTGSRIDSAAYLEYIEATVEFRHVVPAIAFLLAAVGCAALGAAGLTGRLRSSAAGWLLWSVAILACCLFIYREETEFWLQSASESETVKHYASQNEAPLASAAQFLACLCLYAGLPLSNLLQSSNRAQGATSAPDS